MRRRIPNPQWNSHRLMNSYFFIVADRGNVKAYRAEASPARHAQARLVQAFTLVDAHTKPTQKFSDEAGAFPTQTGAGGWQSWQANSIGEKHLDLEETRRLVKQIASHINGILGLDQPEQWSFAAPSEIHQAVLDCVDRRHLQRLTERVTRDLVNVPANEILAHFSAVRPAPEAAA